MKSNWEWALEYTGDPESFDTRSRAFLGFLIKEGLTKDDYVLDVGCGCLAPGAELIRYLKPAHYVGIEPFGLLVNVALQQFPDLELKKPTFLYRSDFDASEMEVKYKYVVSHSVLSHAAHHQLPQLLTNVRKVVDEGAIFLCSYREDQYNSYAESFQYPDVTYFRLRTVMAAGAETGWQITRAVNYEKELRARAPNDTHEILRMVAVPSAAEINERRLLEEETARAEQTLRVEREVARRQELREIDDERLRQAGLA